MRCPSPHSSPCAISPYPAPCAVPSHYPVLITISRLMPCAVPSHCPVPSTIFCRLAPCAIFSYQHPVPCTLSLPGAVH
eukprot:1699648-Pleurochrysis_carterae.AAC.1